MATPLGKSILQSISEFRVRKWFTEEIPNLGTKIINVMQARNEVKDGGIVSAGASLSTTTCNVDTTDMNSALLGRLMATVTALSDADLLAASGAVGQPIFEDGTDASSFVTLASDEEVLLTLVVTNSDGAGDADEDDDGTPLFVAVVAGTDEASAKAATEQLSSTEIQAALEASTSIHDGVTGWAHVAQITYGNPSGTPTLTIVMNRNNVVSDA